jgi:hypothetical protein
MRKTLLTLIATIALFVVPNALASTAAAKASCPTDPTVVVGNAALSAHQGGTSTATFTIPAECPSVQVSLVSYTHSAPFFTWENAQDEVVSDSHTLTYGPGAHSISVSTPDCYYQVDLVQGDVIQKLGPASSNNFYSRQNRLVAADNGGNKSCVPPVVDSCPNLAGVQNGVPSGYIKDGNGNCVIPPTDVCPNLEGVQTSVPTGYTKDGNGNCIIPPTDLCPNIAGVQTQLPFGYVTDVTGSCIYPPTPPKDSCPNIDGIQTSVPVGYIVDGGGNCVIPPQITIVNDVCPNIEGTQSSVPVGLVSDSNGNCVPPVTDVCANIEGVQTKVPTGMTASAAANCAAPPVTVAKIADSCLNLKGIQKTVPKGDVKKSGGCYPIQVKGKKIHKKAKPKALPYTP